MTYLQHAHAYNEIMYDVLFGLQVHYPGGAHPPLGNREALRQAGPALQTKCKLHSSQTRPADPCLLQHDNTGETLVSSYFKSDVHRDVAVRGQLCGTLNGKNSFP